MRNKLAIAATVAVLVLTICALAATFVAVWPDDPSPVATGVEGFEPAQVGEAIGQPIGQSAPSTEVVGPQMPDDGRKAKPRPDRPVPTKSAAPKTGAKQIKYKPAVLQVVTNFEEADVKVNGLPYPEYYEPGAPEGMVLPAGGPYNVEVTIGSNVKVYNLHLRPHETRLLLVDLAGTKSGTPPPAPPKKAEPAKKAEPEKAKDDAKEEATDGGKITVYSKPAGSVIVDGKATDEKTPGTVDLENGRHEVQVKYETGSVSEKKIVRVRNGSRIKLFFRERQK